MNNLTKDINNIVNKYNHFSIANYNKKLNNKKIQLALQIKPYITIDDILMKCHLLGYKGFFIYTHLINIIQQLYNTLLKSKNHDINIIKKTINNTEIVLCYIDSKYECCSILVIDGIFEIVPDTLSITEI